MNTGSTPYLSRTQALILAGGRGKHLYPLTVNRPKPAIPFGGIFRIVDFTLSNCLYSKLPRVALLTQYQHEQLSSYVRYAWGKVWNNSHHAAEPLACLPSSAGRRYRGTADAVFKNLAVLESNRPDHVLIIPGDQVYYLDYCELLAQHVDMQADVTIATIAHPVNDTSHFSVVEKDNANWVTGFVSSSNVHARAAQAASGLVSMGVYAFKTNILIETLKQNCRGRFGYDFGEHVIPSLVGSARVHAYNFRDSSRNAPRYWRAIGTVDDYYDASMDLVRPDSGFDLYAEAGQSSPVMRHSAVTRVNAGCVPRAGVHIQSDVVQSVLSPGVCVERRASVQDSVLMPGVRVGPGAAIRHAIIEEGVHIPADFRIGWDAIEDRKHYMVSPAGVVVVSETPKTRKTDTSVEVYRRFGAMRATA